MNLLQTYQAEQAMYDTNQTIARRLGERRQLMEARAGRTASPSRDTLFQRALRFRTVARLLRGPRLSVVGRLEN